MECASPFVEPLSMTKISDLKGFAYPSPRGISSVVGNLPWHFGTEHLCVAYRTDPKAVAAYLPEPLQPSSTPDVAIVDFGKWHCLWDDLGMPVKNPERTWYDETILWIGGSYKGKDYRVCIQSWVNRDFSLIRGYVMGFNKKFGETYRTIYHAMNPGMVEPGPGTKMSGWLCAHGERLMEGELSIEKRIEKADLPPMMNWPQLNIRYFPSLDPKGPPTVCEIIQLDASDFRFGNKAFGGKGTVKL
ncbi:MAG: acetoacetate decarboxylase family protein, partial [Methylococcales bacterium]